jgi:hypothetical protein
MTPDIAPLTAGIEYEPCFECHLGNGFHEEWCSKRAEQPDIAPDAPTPSKMDSFHAALKPATDAEGSPVTQSMWDSTVRQCTAAIEHANALQALIDGAKGELPEYPVIYDIDYPAHIDDETCDYIDREDYDALRESAALAIAKERQRTEAAEEQQCIREALYKEQFERAESLERQLAAEREKVRRMETALERECKDGDAISYAVGVARTEGGSLQVQKILNAISKHQGRAWLIERNAKHGVTPARWFEERRCFARGDQDLWVYDAHRAVRFDTKEQAEREIQRLFGHEWDKELYPVLPEATEHVFIDAARKEKP